MSKHFGTYSSYISKIVMKYLACFFNDPSKIFCIKSSLTAQLRIAWELNVAWSLLQRNILSKRELKDFKILKNKKRMDNRHLCFRCCNNSLCKLEDTIIF
jgi:CRISPR-associated endonuclease Csn1